jgi:hypothetical protein
MSEIRHNRSAIGIAHRTGAHIVEDYGIRGVKVQNITEAPLVGGIMTHDAVRVRYQFHLYGPDLRTHGFISSRPRR